MHAHDRENTSAAPSGTTAASRRERPDGASPRQRELLLLQRAAGNAALAAALRDPTGATRPATVQRQTPAPAPAAAPPAPPVPGTAPAPAPAAGDSWWSKLDPTRKTRYKFVDSRQLYTAYAGKRFAWSTTKENKPGHAPAELDLSGPAVIPIPLPVGPVFVRVKGGVSTYAGGNALLDVTVNDVYLDVSPADFLQLGVGVLTTLNPLTAPGGLVQLGTLRLRGEAKLRARAAASLDAGIDAYVKGLVDPKLWPVAGYIKGALGAGGFIRFNAEFGGATGVELSWRGLRMLPGTHRAEGSIGLSTGLSLQAQLSAGFILGYSPATIERELWSVSAGAQAGFDVGTAVRLGDKPVTMNVADDGTPEVDVAQLLIDAQQIIDLLFRRRNAANDVFRPYRPGQAPPGQPPAALVLPAAKGHHLELYRSFLGELHHDPGTVRKTDQVPKWVRSVRQEMNNAVILRAISLGLVDRPEDAVTPPSREELHRRARAEESPLYRPFWSRTQMYSTAMGVDHIVEYQVLPTSFVDEPWNFEMLDPSFNSSAGSGLSANIDRLRASLPPQWQNQTIVFTSVTAPASNRGQTWSHDEIVRGDHLDVYERMRGRVERPQRGR
ncbi:hypothetical protein [Catellatospora sp. TT07R-123]|uniref:hypothetical protein n=1 Tax=Catellatospora sp. TT07R-123 TaxID=2733863 RepID=UPI001BB4309C|nr:hypothetical protein [Catellatospora sp. TT07R-123]